MYGQHGKLRAHPGQRDALADHLLRAAELLGAMEGCYLYVVSAAPDDPDALWVTEVWRTQTDHQASLGDAAIRALIAEARGLIESMPDQTELEPLGGKGLPVYGIK